MWKADLTRAYRQLRADPLDAPLLGLKVKDEIYIDLCPPFGCRSSVAICQRMANALVYMMSQLGFKIIAYLDDYASCHKTPSEAQQAFDTFNDLADRLGLKLATHKSCPPTTEMEWLGYLVNSNKMSISIPHDKLQQVVEECSLWPLKTKANKRMIQSIAGRIIYVANCIPPARKFTARVLAALRMLQDEGWITLSDDFKADIRWFVHYAQVSNGIHFYRPHTTKINIECDSSMFGAGGVATPYCYAWEYSTEHMNRFTDIHHLEAINIIVAYQTLAAPQKITPATVIIWTDNMASSWALSTGKTKDQVLAACARQIWLFAATNSHEIEIRHKKGLDIPIADALSRMSRDLVKAKVVKSAVESHNLVFVTPILNDYVFFDSTL